MFTSNTECALRRLFLLSMLAVIALRPLSAQSPAGPPDPSAPTVAPTRSPASPLAVNPLTGLTSTSSTNYHPLTGKERWQLYWRQNYWSLGAYFGPVVTALALDQATGSPSEWGGGFAGYGRRVGSRTLLSVIQGNVQAGLAAPLHEDVRYISAGRGGFKHRALHAIVFSFMTYNNQGHATVNVANLTGFYASAAISTTWIPTDDSLGRYTLVHGTENLGFSIPVNLLQEFWPDICRRVHRP